jgi:UPF0716 protein FxsA
VPLQQTLDDWDADANAQGKDTPMNVAKWLLLGVLALPLAELAVFIAVAAGIGFVWALGLVLAGSLAGVLLLRHAGGNHVARIRLAMADGSFTALRADGTGGTVLLAGFLLLIPGFITDIVALLLLLLLLRRALAAAFGYGAPPSAASGVVDLAPEQWRRLDDPALPGQHPDERKG